jgi:hypothetical protein
MIIAALLPFVVLAIVWLLFASLFPIWGPRRAFLRALVAWGAWVILSVELLSILHAITFAGLLMAWLIPLAVCGSWLVMRWRAGAAPRLDFSWLRNWEMKVSLAVLLAVLTLTALVAWLAPPNTFDSLRYHLPRVAHWAQNHTVAHFATDTEVQNSFSPTAEYAILHVYVLAGNDRMVNFIEWLAMLGSLVGVSLIAGLLGAGAGGQMLSALFAATLPMGIIQASSTMNDYVVALWVVIVAEELLTLWKEQDAPVPVSVFTGLAAGLAVSTKATAFAFLLPFAVVFTYILFRRTRLALFAGLAALIVALAGLMNAGYMSRNVMTYGTVIDTRMSDRLGNQLFTWQGIISNLSRNASEHLGTPWPAANARIERLVRGVHFKMGLSIDDPRTTAMGEFRVLPLTAEEAIAPNPLHFYIFLLAVAASLVGYRRAGARLLIYELLVLSTFLVFSIVFKWQIFSSRLQLSFFLLCAPAVGAVADVFLDRRVPPLIGIGLALVSGYALYSISARPLVAQGASLLTAPRESFYGVSAPGAYQGFQEASSQIEAGGCTQVGLATSGAGPEYLVWHLLNAPRSDLRIEWLAPANPSARYIDPSFHPCAILCQNCGDRATFRDLPLVYSRGNLQLYLQPAP